MKIQCDALVYLLVVIICIPICSAYKILGVFPTFAPSHYKLGHSLMKGLADAGNSVTVISPYRLSHPIHNYREIYVEDMDKHWICKYA